ncbi:UNVERIFIED_CONTAM: hypothetical protein K2H54_038000 [Gekko kuhli]
MVAGPGALVPAGPSGMALMGPVPGALPGRLTPAILDAFWDTPVSRAILDRLTGIERRLDGYAASAQNDMSSLELFQAEVLHRLDAFKQRSAGSPSPAVMAVNEDSRPIQTDVEGAGRREGAQREVVAEVPVRDSGRPVATQTCDISWPLGPVSASASTGSQMSSPGVLTGPRAVSTPVPSTSLATGADQPVTNVAPPVGAGVQLVDGTGVMTSTDKGSALASAGGTQPSGSGHQTQGGVWTGCAPPDPGNKTYEMVPAKELPSGYNQLGLPGRNSSGA